jgi:hypothetical protein
MNDSSHVQDAIYDETRGVMRVVFKGGQEYEWNVPRDEFEGLHQAPSPGSYLHQWIIPRYGKGNRKRG